MWRVAWLWKRTTDDYSKTLTIKFLKKFWYLDIGKLNKTWTVHWTRNWNANWNISILVSKDDSVWNVRVNFTQTDREWNKKELDYNIKLVSTSCNYWWIRR